MRQGVCNVLSVLVLFSITNTVLSQSCSIENRNNEETLPTTTWFPQVLSSPGFPTSYYSSMDCRWIFNSGSAGVKVVIDIRQYYIEDPLSCPYDYLAFYDGNSINSEAEVFCGSSSTGKLLVTSGQYGLLRLKSDFSVQLAGFQLFYLLGETPNSDCSAPILKEASDSGLNFQASPVWPNFYDTTQTCSYRITPNPTNYGVQFFVVITNLQAGEECYSDLLEIYDGADDTATKLFTICDSRYFFTSQPGDYTGVSTGSNLFVKFTTRRSGINRRGFVIGFQAIDIGLPTTTTPVATTQNLVSTCVSTGYSLTATSVPQIVESPGYPQFYSINLDCKWLITAPVGDIIVLTVVDSLIQSIEGCFGDHVFIYDGPSTSNPLVAQFCGSSNSNVTSTSNKLLISFQTDSSVGERGFRVQFVSESSSLPSCVETANSSAIIWTNLTATTTPQYFESPNYPSNYDSSEVHHWLIHNPTDSGVIYVETVDSRIEASVSCSFDSVTMYRGPCTNYPVMTRFCGTETPTIQQNTGTYVLIIFVADHNTEFRGFRMKYYVGVGTSEESDLASKIGIIVGSVLGVIAVLALIAVLVVAYRKGLLPGLSPPPDTRKLSISSSASSISSASGPSSSGHPPRRLRPIGHVHFMGGVKGGVKGGAKGGAKGGIKEIPSLESYSKKMLLPPIKKK